MLDMEPDIQLLKVGAATCPAKLSHAVFKYTEEGKQVVLTCLGVASLGVGIKSIILANRQTVTQGYFFLVTPSYQTQAALRPEYPAEERTVVVLKLKKAELSLWAGASVSRKVSAEKGRYVPTSAKPFPNMQLRFTEATRETAVSTQQT